MNLQILRNLEMILKLSLVRLQDLKYVYTFTLNVIGKINDEPIYYSKTLFIEFVLKDDNKL